MYTVMDKHTDQWLPWTVMDVNKIKAEQLKQWMEKWCFPPGWLKMLKPKLAFVITSLPRRSTPSNGQCHYATNTTNTLYSNALREPINLD